MTSQRLLSVKEAAAELGLHRITVGQLVKTLGIKTHQLPYNGNAKGLDADGIAQLRKATSRTAKRRAMSA